MAEARHPVYLMEASPTRLEPCRLVGVEVAKLTGTWRLDRTFRMIRTRQRLLRTDYFDSLAELQAFLADMPDENLPEELPF